jgi:hypothetical protein
VDPQDGRPAGEVRRVDRDPPVEATRSQERRVQHLGPVGGGEDDDALGAAEPVHLGQDLVEGLLSLVVGAERGSAGAGLTDAVELVDEHDRRGHRLGFDEQIAHPAGPDADDHLDELARRHREERHARLARHRACQQRLARAGRTGQQHTPGDGGAEPAVPRRVP